MTRSDGVSGDDKRGQLIGQFCDVVDCPCSPLQTELAKTFFRRWKLYPLGSGPIPTPATKDSKGILRVIGEILLTGRLCGPTP
jgi:hypothetical protein